MGRIFLLGQSIFSGFFFHFYILITLDGCYVRFKVALFDVEYFCDEMYLWELNVDLMFFDFVFPCFLFWDGLIVMLFYFYLGRG